VTVSLVGAGPGDPGLFTRRGAELLARADVVVYDRLIGRELLDLAPPHAQMVDVGKTPGEASRQTDINALLIEHGRAGRQVVRLKGGDPFVFGRGGEEAEALRNAGIEYEVVPGVSSAFAAPAAAGIPVTHRSLSTSVTVVTGRVGDPSAPGGVDWLSLGRAGGTLVILMGMSQRAEIAEQLARGGRAADTPVAVVYWGTTPHQQVERTTLGDLASVDLPAPSVIVVGPVAALDVGSTSLGPGAR
jgi:uroporphyrin-III C-methyltransferase